MTGIVIIGISLLPYPVIQSSLNNLAADKHADFFSYSLYQRVRLIAATCGLILILISAFGAIRFEQTRETISRFFGSVSGVIANSASQIAAHWQSDGRLYRVCLLAVFLAGILVRLSLLFTPIRSDEAYTYVDFSSKAFIHAISDYSAPNNHILHTLLVQVSVKIFGSQPWAIRLPAFLAGVFCIPAAYLVARLIYKRDSALLAAGLIAACPVLIEYSVYARGYSMICLISLLLIALGAMIIKEQSTGAWFFFVLLSALGFYTIPIMLYPYACIMSWIAIGLAFRQQARRLREVGLSVIAVLVITVLLYSPVIINSGAGSLVSNEYVSSKSWNNFVAGFPPAAWATLGQWARGVPIIVSGLVVLGFLLAVVFNRRLSSARPSLLFPTIVSLAILLVIQRVNPYSRVWLFLLPWIIVAASAGFLLPLQILPWFGGKHFQSLLPILGVLICVGLAINARLSFQAYQPDDGFSDAKAVAAYLAPRLGAGDRVVTVVPDISPLEYYFIMDGTSTHYLYVDYADAGRLLIVVDEQKQSLSNVMNKNDIPGESYSQPALLEIIGSTHIYQMIKNHSSG
jgi:hypothetical protein